MGTTEEPTGINTTEGNEYDSGTIGKNIRKARRDLDMTQDELAERLARAEVGEVIYGASPDEIAGMFEGL